MNIWTKKSIELANQQNYLDLLYKVYPMSVNLRRELKKGTKEEIKTYFNNRQSTKLLETLLDQEVFPVKDSYVAYLKRDRTAVKRNPATVERVTGMLYEMGLGEIFDKASTPKETNRQIGPLFTSWINTGALGCKITLDANEFTEYNGNIIFNGSDNQMYEYANEHLGYIRNKGLDFMAKFNNKYIIGEAKFLTDFGGHQNAQFADAMSTLRTKLNKTDNEVIVIAILDGVLYIKNNSKMHKSITENNDEIIISAVLLRDFLFSL